MPDTVPPVTRAGLVWTEDAPSVPGFYWYRGVGSDDADLRGQTQPVEVSLSLRAAFVCGSESFKYLTEMGGRWAGPLEAPRDG